MSGFNGGGCAGCDYWFGSIVVGAEGDWSVVNKSGQARQSQNFINQGLLTSAGPFLGNPNGYVEAQERWYATARGRVGYAVDKWLFFVSGGAAWTKVENSNFITTAPATAYSAQDATRPTGWTVGAGVDYAPAVLNGHWTVRAEYLYVTSATSRRSPLRC
jgi:outer membrane immunogenic protein